MNGGGAVKIIVLVKQVPNTTQVKIDPKTNNLVREGVPSVINAYDLYAVEEALSLRERFGGTVTVLSMGPRQAAEALKYTMAMGADRAVLLSDRAFAGSDTLATSYTLAAGIRRLGVPDLILCGKQAADGDTAQVPAELAEHLGIGCLTYVARVQNISDGRALVERTMDFAGIRAEVRLPAVLTVNKGINEPRLPALRDMVRAMYMECELMTAADVDVEEGSISLAGSPTQVVKIFSPERKKGGRMLSRGTDEQVEELLRLLAEAKLVSAQ